MMTHNWYAAVADGEYDATYEVYVGDADGVPLAGYKSDTVTLRFRADGLPSRDVPLGVPWPLPAILIAVGGAAILARRRHRHVVVA